MPPYAEDPFPTKVELEQLFIQKYGEPSRTGWAPRQRYDFGYYLPSDVYEALLTKLVSSGCTWLDVGGGHQIFPENPKLAATLAARSSFIAAVDPSENVHQNKYVHERVQSPIETYRTDKTFDLVTLRMVAEHVADPEPVMQALRGLVRPAGLAVVLTVNHRAPLTLLSRLLPFEWHHPIKKLFWGSEEADTFPVRYRMNSRRVLKGLFESHGFDEAAFAYLDDLSALGHFRIGSYLEIRSWQLLRTLGLRYPENCLLGIYRRRRD